MIGDCAYDKEANRASRSRRGMREWYQVGGGGCLVLEGWPRWRDERVVWCGGGALGTNLGWLGWS